MRRKVLPMAIAIVIGALLPAAAVANPYHGKLHTVYREAYIECHIDRESLRLELATLRASHPQ